METTAAIAILVGIIIVVISYQSWLRQGVRARDLSTQMTVAQVKAAFGAKVAGMGWKVIDDDNPMVAQSGLLGGRRQEISMRLTPVDGGLAIHIWPSRLWTKGLAQVPYKAHTIRMRMNAFERAVSSPIGQPAAPLAPYAANVPTAQPGPITLPAPMVPAIPQPAVPQLHYIQPGAAAVPTVAVPTPAVLPAPSPVIPRDWAPVAAVPPGMPIGSSPWWAEHAGGG